LSSLVTLTQITKQHGAQVLFKDLSLSILEKDRIGIVGPNGSGKSTLMKIISDVEQVDSGTVQRKKDLTISYSAQSASFDEEKSIYDYAFSEAEKYFPFEADKVARASLARLKFSNFEAMANSLSGGQKKRLQLALAICSEPDLLILDEPTNHLDIESILMLEQFLQNTNFAWIVVSHDRWFLEQTAKKVIEVNQYYKNGIYSSDGGYEEFIQKKAEFLKSEQSKLSSLKNIARRELSWLRKGPKARGTKAKHRVDSAHEVLDAVAEASSRMREKEISISFSETGRKTKRLIELVEVNKNFEGIKILEDLSMLVVSKQVIGILGKNGSGKTTLINLITEELKPDSGQIKKTTGVSVAHFKQFSESVDPKTALKDVLAKEGDSVYHKGSSIHVAPWAKKFNFSFEQLNQPYGTLSGGEQARARIANLMLSTADILILDEPTNDLDIETLEVLEEAIMEFPGAVILVTHDRYMISRLCSNYIALQGEGAWQNYASYEQWQNDLTNTKSKNKKSKKSKSKEKTKEQKSDKKLSHKELKEYNSMEKKINKAELKLAEIQKELETPNDKLEELCEELSAQQEKIDQLYARWEELEGRIS